MPVRTPFTPAQTAYVIAHYATATKAELLAMFPGRNWDAVTKLGSRLSTTTTTARRAYASRLWTAPMDAYLRAHYPSVGARAVATHLHVAEGQATARARHLRVARVRPAAAPKAKPAPVPRKPYPTGRASRARPVVETPLPVKLRPMLPNLNAAKEARKKSERRVTAAVGITAEQVRKLGPNDPARRAYTLGGVAGWQQWKAQQAA